MGLVGDWDWDTMRCDETSPEASCSTKQYENAPTSEQLVKDKHRRDAIWDHEEPGIKAKAGLQISNWTELGRAGNEVPGARVLVLPQLYSLDKQLRSALGSQIRKYFQGRQRKTWKEKSQETIWLQAPGNGLRGWSTMCYILFLFFLLFFNLSVACIFVTQRDNSTFVAVVLRKSISIRITWKLSGMQKLRLFSQTTESEWLGVEPTYGGILLQAPVWKALFQRKQSCDESQAHQIYSWIHGS